MSAAMTTTPATPTSSVIGRMGERPRDRSAVRRRVVAAPWARLVPRRVRAVGGSEGASWRATVACSWMPPCGGDVQHLPCAGPGRGPIRPEGRAVRPFGRPVAPSPGH